MALYSFLPLKQAELQLWDNNFCFYFSDSSFPPPPQAQPFEDLSCRNCLHSHKCVTHLYMGLEHFALSRKRICKWLFGFLLWGWERGSVVPTKGKGFQIGIQHVLFSSWVFILKLRLEPVLRNLPLGFCESTSMVLVLSFHFHIPWLPVAFWRQRHARFFSLKIWHYSEKEADFFWVISKVKYIYWLFSIIIYARHFFHEYFDTIFFKIHDTVKERH